MASINGVIDQYGFERADDFDFKSYEAFMSEYLAVLARRMSKWEKLIHGKDQIARSRKVKRYIRKGIPSDLRTDVWTEISGAAALSKANSSKFKDLLDGPKDPNFIDYISRDLPRTYPENVYFRDGGDSLIVPLSNVLTAYAHHNPAVGYCQGLNYIAGMLLLVTKNEQLSFWLLVQLLQNYLPDFYSTRMIGVRVECAVLDRLIQQKEPALHAHFKQYNIDLELFTSKWFVCIFMDVLPVETVLRIWDSLFYEGSKIILRVAYTLIVMNKALLMQKQDFAEICSVFKSIATNALTLNCHRFMKKCFEVPGSFSLAMINGLRRDCLSLIESQAR